MLSFLSTYGPLGWSILIGPYDKDTGWIDAAAAMAGFVDTDPRAQTWAYLFSSPVRLVRDAATSLKGDAAASIAVCLAAPDQTPKMSLLRGLLRQAFDLAVEGARARPCQGCGRLFVKTDTPSQARERRGWKRTDAIYHLERCRRVYLERQRRKQGRQQANPSP
jgi:hypothetical protein